MDHTDIFETFWDKISEIESEDFDDEKINRLLRFKAIEQNLENVHRILDLGAGTGVFSIPLAQMGYDVVHFDLSESMIEIAKENAEGLENIRFVKGDAADLRGFDTNEFDLLMCFDGAISFSGKRAGKVISEACRVAKKVMMSVSNKSCMAATWLNYSMNNLNRIHPSVKEMMKTGYFCKDDYDDAEHLTGIYELKAYDTEELKAELEKNGMTVKECRSIGSFTHLYLMHLYRQYDKDEVYRRINKISDNLEFIELCDYYDKNVMPNGMGSFRRAGIFAVAEKILK